MSRTKKRLKRGRSCYSCFGCQNICPTKAISYEYDEEGLCVPVIDFQRCVDCGKCVELCCKETRKEDWKEAKYYVGASKEEKILRESSSGGMFSELAIHILNQGGIVFGATFDAEEKRIRHVGIEKVNELPILRKSKYVQSDCSDIYKEVLFHVRAGRKVLFCGTPCQVGVLREILGKEYDHILLIDFCCHGVASARIFSEYLNLMRGKVERIDFRHDGGDSNFYLKLNIVHDDSHLIEDIRVWWDNALCRLFLDSVSLKYTCMNCKYAEYKHPSDIMIGDFSDKNLASSQGVNIKHPSIIGVNTQYGEKVWSEISTRLTYAEVFDEPILSRYFRPHRSLKGTWGYNIKEWITYRKEYAEKGFKEATLKWLYSEYVNLLGNIKQCEKKKIWVYGAGAYGEKILYLLELFVPERKVAGFIVSQKKKNLHRIKDIDIFAIDDIKLCRDDLVILAVNEKNEREILDLLRRTREELFRNNNIIRRDGSIVL